MRWVVVLVVILSLGCETRAQRLSTDVPFEAQSKAPAQQVFPDQRAAFSAAYAYVQLGEFEKARPIFEAIIADYLQLQDYSLHYVALSHARAGRNQLAIGLWQRLMTNHPRSVHFAEAALELGRLLRAGRDLAGARAVLVRAEGAGDKAVQQAAALEIARIDVAEGDVVAAYKRLMRIRRETPGSVVGADAKREVEALRNRAPELSPRGKALQNELEILVEERDYSNAIALADRLLGSAPKADRPKLMRLRADADSGAGLVDESLATLRNLYRGYPDSDEAPPALFRRGRVLWNRDRTSDAEECFRYFVRRYSRHELAADALYALGRIDESAGNHERALESYRKLVRSYPRATVTPEAGWRVGWVLYRQRHWRDAAEAFADLARRSGSAASDAIYWQGRALEHDNRVVEARKLYQQVIEEYPTNYYAYWAGHRLGQALPREFSVTDPKRAQHIGSAPLASVEQYHLTRALELQAASLPAPALEELRAFERDNSIRGAHVQFLIDAYLSVEAYPDAIRVTRSTGDPDLQVAYPLAFWSQVTAQTKQNGLDPLLVLSLMRQESLFDAGALSPANARGLMQLLPSTAVEVAGRIGKPAPAAGDLFDPDLNITLGTAHLRYLLDLYDGDRIRALAAYNGGENAVARWNRQSGTLALDEWVENISYRETRKYVKRVLGHYLDYRDLYTNPKSGS